MKHGLQFKSFFAIALFVLSFFLFPILIIWKQNIINATGIKISHIKKEIDELRSENISLTLELESLKRNNKIEQTAREKLGLIYPCNDKVRFIRYDLSEK